MWLQTKVPAVCEAPAGIPARAQIAHDRLHRQAREIGGRALRDDRPVERLRTGIVRNARIIEIDGDALDRDFRASARLPDANDDLRVERLDLGFEPGNRLAETQGMRRATIE